MDSRFSEQVLDFGKNGLGLWGGGVVWCGMEKIESKESARPMGIRDLWERDLSPEVKDVFRKAQEILKQAESAKD